MLKENFGKKWVFEVFLSCWHYSPFKSANYGIIIELIFFLLFSREQAVQVNKGPDVNFGLDAPTPGFGFEWRRSRDTELETQKNDPELVNIERFDRFTASK